MPSAEWLRERPKAEGCYMMRATWHGELDAGVPCRVFKRGKGFVVHVDGYRDLPLSEVHHRYLLWRKVDAAE